MQSFESWKKVIGNKKNGFYHHAYFVEGGGEAIRQQLEDFLATEFGIHKDHNPDFHEYDLPTLYIADAHTIRLEESRRALTPDTKKVFFITTNHIPHDAGNALLKMLEEPTPDALFFFFASSREILLPTLRSRFVILGERQAVMTEEGKEVCQKFLESSKKDRLDMFQEMIKEKDKAHAMKFLGELEQYLYERVSLEKAGTDTLVFFDDIRHARNYLRDTAASVKLIMEQIALLAPEQEKHKGGK